MLLDGSALESANAILGNPTLNNIILAIAIYFLRDFANTVKGLKKELSDYKLEVAKEYATQEYVKESLRTHEDHLHS